MWRKAENWITLVCSVGYLIKPGHVCLPCGRSLTVGWDLPHLSFIKTKSQICQQAGLMKAMHPLASPFLDDSSLCRFDQTNHSTELEKGQIRGRSIA